MRVLRLLCRPANDGCGEQTAGGCPVRAPQPHMPAKEAAPRDLEVHLGAADAMLAAECRSTQIVLRSPGLPAARPVGRRLHTECIRGAGRPVNDLQGPHPLISREQPQWEPQCKQTAAARPHLPVLQIVVQVRLVGRRQPP